MALEDALVRLADNVGFTVVFAGVSLIGVLIIDRILDAVHSRNGATPEPA